MLEFIVKHKYCGMEKTISGHNVWDALRENDLDINIWIVQEVRQIKEQTAETRSAEMLSGSCVFDRSAGPRNIIPHLSAKINSQNAQT